MDDELSFFQFGINLLFVDLSVEDCSVSDDCLNHQNLNLWRVLDIFLFILFDCHVERHFLGEEILLDEESRSRERLRIVSVLGQFVHDLRFYESMFVKDELFAFLGIQVVVVVALTTERRSAGQALHVQQASLRDREEFFAALAEKRSFEGDEMSLSAFMFFMFAIHDRMVIFPFLRHELFKVEIPLFQIRPNRNIFDN
jgi:hypothetical protein